MSAQPNVVWTSMLDGRYTVSVIRTRPYHGQLTISENANPLFSKETSLAYDAIFGPDVADVQAWQADAIEFIDGRSEG